MSLELRCPEDIDGMRQDWLRRYYEVDPELAEDYANIRLPEQPETMEEYLQQTSEAELEEGFFEALLSTIDSQRLGNTLTGMIWGKVEFSENENELITSDRPIIRTDRLARNHSHIVLPIGPKRLFFAAETQRVADEILAMNKKELVQNVNLQIVQQALKYVYARRYKPLRFVAKHMSSQQRPRVFQLLLAENARSHID